MDLAVSDREVEFRDAVRSWLDTHLPRVERPIRGPAMRAFDVTWQAEIHAAGFAGLTWPVEYGGRGLGLLEQLIWFEEYARAGGPYNGVCFVGLTHAGPTLLACGTEAQKLHHLPRILAGEEAWSQGFSEPDAGSDLGAIRTAAVRDGDELVVNGQKAWTSFAQHTDVQELLVRTDPTAAKHAGLTWLICDLSSPGVTIHPVETMAHVPDVAEVFYDDVRIPLTAVVGRIDGGWNVAMSTLAFERGTAFVGEQIDLARVVDELVALATRGPRATTDGALLERLAVVRAEALALRSLTLLSTSRVARTGQPGPESSMIRLFFSELKQRVYRLALDVLGPEALELATVDGIEWVRRHLASFSATIGAGTAEMQRNVIAERVLGLPRGQRG